MSDYNLREDIERREVDSKTFLIKRKYYVFGCMQYYPSGGMGDYLKSFETKDEAKNYIENSTDYEDYDLAWVDDTGELVFE